MSQVGKKTMEHCKSRMYICVLVRLCTSPVGRHSLTRQQERIRRAARVRVCNYKVPNFAKFLPVLKLVTHMHSFA